MMYGLEKGIMIKQIPQGTENMTWSEFFDIVKDMFGEKAEGDKTWEAYFEPESQKTAEPEKEPSNLEDALENTEIAPAQVPDESEEKSQKNTPTPEENVPGEVENLVPDVEKTEEADGSVENEEQIPGQDSIMNHEEYMPKPEVGVPEEIPETETVSENEETKNEESEPVDSEAKRPVETEEQQKAAEPVPEEIMETEPEDMKPENAPAQSEVVEKPIRRKEFLDSLTEYGAADYIAKAFKGFGTVTFSQLQNTNFWLRWMDTKVDHLGRPWVD